MRQSAVLAVLLTGLSAGLCSAGDPAPPAVVVAEPPPFVLANPQWGRINYHAVWQNYGVDRLGYWRPRVVYTPDGAFYYYDGRPFPWPAVTVRPLEFMPRANDD